MSEPDYYERTHRGSRWRTRGDQPFLNWRRIRTLREGDRRELLLDIGSGEGHFARRASQHFDVVATEYLESGARRTAGAIGAGRVIRADGTQLPIQTGSVSVVTLWDVTEHVIESPALFAECRRVLREGGLLAMSTPNPDALSVRKRGRGSIQFSDDTHVNIQPVQEWRRQLEAGGFAVLRAGGDSWWDPPYASRVPRAAYVALAQVMFATRFCWPVKTAENTVVLARAGVSAAG